MNKIFPLSQLRGEVAKRRGEERERGREGETERLRD